MHLYQVTDIEVPLAFQGLVLANFYICLFAFAPVDTLNIYIYIFIWTDKKIFQTSIQDFIKEKFYYRYHL